jgi:hypothetical protein
MGISEVKSFQKEIQMSISRWWASVPRLPNWGDDLRDFLSGTIGLTAGLVLENPPRVFWANCESAYADQSKRRIGISYTMLSDKAEERYNPKATKDEAVSAVLGAMVHEIAHFVYTPPTLKDLLNTGVPVNDVSLKVANIVEDIFIEDAIVKREKSYGWMIRSLWDYFLPFSRLEKLVDSWDGQDFSDLKLVLDVMIAWKRVDFPFVPRSDKEQALRDLCYSAKGVYSLQERKDIIEAVYRFLVQESKSEEQGGEGEEGESEEQGEGEGEEQKEGSGKSKNTSESNGSAAKKSGDTANKETTSGVFEASGNDISASGKGEFISEAFEPRSAKMEHEVEFDYVGGMQVVWLTPSSRRGKTVKSSVKWREFAKWAIDQGTVRRIRGNASMSGKLTHPARLLDDGQVFSKAHISSPSGANGVSGAPQDIILIDLSGSMSGGLAGERISKLDAAFEAAQGAMEGLTQARHRVAVYGHSTSYSSLSDEGCAMYIIKEFAQTVEAGKTAFEALCTEGAKLGNADAHAIDAVVKKFRKDGTPMRLWVISDGQPACGMYCGDSGEIATKAAVNRARKNGVEVVSFSIDKVALEPNDNIYGKANNFDAQDLNVVRKVMKKFFV